MLVSNCEYSFFKETTSAINSLPNTYRKQCNAMQSELPVHEMKLLIKPHHITAIPLNKSEYRELTDRV